MPIFGTTAVFARLVVLIYSINIVIIVLIEVNA